MGIVAYPLGVGNRCELVVDAFDVFARRDLLEAVGIGFCQGVREIIGHRPVPVQVLVKHHRVVEQAVVEGGELPVFRILLALTVSELLILGPLARVIVGLLVLEPLLLCAARAAAHRR